jgi:DNA adenine methylase
VDSVIKWHGGKDTLANKHISLFPEHKHFVEPYFGGGSVLFKKPIHLVEGHSEVVNDLNGQLTNFWKVLQDDYSYEEFKRFIEATPFSECEFEDADKAIFIVLSNRPNVEQATRFFVRCRQSRQALFKDFATLSRNRTRRGMNEQVSAWLTAIDGLPEVHARLKRVVILNRPALEVIKQQDSANTFFYLDPPYLHDTRTSKEAYEFEMSELDHRELLDLLVNIDGRFMLCGYPSELYNNHAKICNWTVKDFDVKLSSSSKMVKDYRVERLWMNY